MDSRCQDDILIIFDQGLRDLELSGFGDVCGAEDGFKAALPRPLDDLVAVSLEFLRVEMGVRIDESQDISPAYVLFLSVYCSSIFDFR
jgi:hypothetical protein